MGRHRHTWVLLAVEPTNSTFLDPARFFPETTFITSPVSLPSYLRGLFLAPFKIGAKIPPNASSMESQIKSYKNQVGGHCCLLTRESSVGEEVILKPAVKREVLFYEETLPHLKLLKKFVPRYHGLELPPSPHGHQIPGVTLDDVPYITMENLTSGYSRPCDRRSPLSNCRSKRRTSLQTVRSQDGHSTAWT